MGGDEKIISALKRFTKRNLLRVRPVCKMPRGVAMDKDLIEKGYILTGLYEIKRWDVKKVFYLNFLNFST